MKLIYFRAISVFILLFFTETISAQLLPKQDSVTSLFGYVNPKGDWKIAPKFNQAFPFQEKVARVITAGSYYLINPKGKFLSAPYQYIGWADDKGNEAHALFQKETIAVKKGRLWGLIGIKGNAIFPPRYGAIFSPVEDRLKVSSFDTEEELLKFGLIDFQGNEIAPPIFEEIQTDFAQGLFKVGNFHPRLGWLWGVLNRNGEILLKVRHIEIANISEQLIAAQDTATFLFSLYDYQGGKVSGATFQMVKSQKEGYAIAAQSGRYGMLNAQTGETILPFQYRYIRKDTVGWKLQAYPTFQLASAKGETGDTFYFDRLKNIGKGIYRFWLNGIAGITTLANETISYHQFETVFPFEKGHAIVERKGKKGVINEKGDNTLPTHFIKIEKERSDLWWAVDTTNVQHLFDPVGKKLLANYQLKGRIHHNRYLVEKAGKLGFLNEQLEEVIAPQFVQAESFTGEQACVKTAEGYFGAIDLNGNWIIRPHVDSLCSFAPDLFFFKNDGKVGVLNREGIELSKVGTEQYFIRDTLLYVQNKGKWGLINRHGKQVLPVRYDSISPIWPDGMVHVFAKGRPLFMDTESSTLPQPQRYAAYEEIGKRSSQKRIPVKQHDKWGFMDHVGQLRITTQFDSVQLFSQGYAGVQLGNKWGFIDLQGNLVLQPHFDEVAPFDERGAVVQQKGKKGVIDKEGNNILPFQYDQIEKSQHGNWLVREGKRWGLFAQDGLQGIYPKYDFVADVGNGLVITRKNGNYGFDQLNGFSVIFPTYDDVRYNAADGNFFLITAPQTIIWQPGD